MKENIKPYLFLQCWGLGDIIFCQSIAHHYIKKGHTVIWPVKDEYFDGVNRAYPKINWVPESIVLPELFNVKEKIEIGGLLIMPIRWSDSYMKVPYKEVMFSKYSMNDMDWKEWRFYAHPKRDPDREEELMRQLGLAKHERYNLISMNFGSGVKRTVDINVSNTFRNIEMNFVEGFSMFDWCGIIERARTIHAVSSSSLYLFEVLNLRAEEIHLYARKPVEQNLDFVKPLLTKKYTLHE